MLDILEPFRGSRFKANRFGFRFNLNNLLIGTEGNRIIIELYKDVEFRRLKTVSPGPVTTSDHR